MKPSNFTTHPYDSVLKNNESETVARNIMVILARTGDTFRPLSWEEYSTQRMKDGNFTLSEQAYFERVSGFCTTEEAAKAFCQNWGR